MKIIALVLISSAFLFSQQQTIGSIVRLDPELDNLLAPNVKIEVIADGFEWSEGPVWMGGNYLLFNDIPTNTMYKWSEGTGLRVFLRPAGYAIGLDPSGEELGSNGLYVHPVDTSLIICDHGNRCLARLNQENWIKTILVDTFEGKRLNSPNDLVIRSDGYIYFTDPPYGLQGLNKSPKKELPFNGVYHLSPRGELTVITKDIPFPNGIILSPDEQTLYVANSGSEPFWRAYDVAANGSVSNERLFFDATELRESGLRGGCDGMTVDKDGNLWATGPGGVLIITPQGKLLGRINTGTATSNCCFGGVNGNELYITADMYVCRVITKTTGAQ